MIIDWKNTFSSYTFISKTAYPPPPIKKKKYLKRVEEQFQPPQNEVSHRVLVYIAEGCHHEVHREDDAIHAKQRDQNECGFSQASAKPRTRER